VAVDVLAVRGRQRLGDVEVDPHLGVARGRHKTHARSMSEKGVRLAQKMQVGPCSPVVMQL
jgi:hypothetical protein